MTRRTYVLVAAAVLLLIALVRPTIGGDEPSVTRIAGDRDPNIFLIVDRSADMADQIDSVRGDIDEVIDRYPNARFALISFDTRPALDWPLSADSWSLRPVLAAVEPFPRGVDVLTNAGAASTVLRYQLISAVQQYPQAQNLVFYFGSGAPNSEAPQREFQVPGSTVDGGAVFGYGPGAAPALQAVADQIGVDYLPRDQLDSLDGALPEVADVAQDPESPPPVSGFELYWGLAGIAAMLILFEFHQALRHLRRTRLDRIPVGR